MSNTQKIHRQELKQSRGPMYQVQATVAIEHKQMRLDMIATAAAGPALSICVYRGHHKIFIQELPMSIPKELSDKHFNAEDLQDLNARNFRG